MLLERISYELLALLASSQVPYELLALVFVSSFQLSVRQDKEKWQSSNRMLAIYLHIRRGVKCLGNMKLENNSYFIICIKIVPKTLGMQTRYFTPTP